MIWTIMLFLCLMFVMVQFKLMLAAIKDGENKAVFAVGSCVFISLVGIITAVIFK